MQLLEILTVIINCSKSSIRCCYSINYYCVLRSLYYFFIMELWAPFSNFFLILTNLLSILLFAWFINKLCFNIIRFLLWLILIRLMFLNIIIIILSRLLHQIDTWLLKKILSFNSCLVLILILHLDLIA